MFKKAMSFDGPLMTYALIASCCLLFLVSPSAELSPPDGARSELLRAQADYFARWGVVPAQLWDGPVPLALDPLTALFVHGNWLHLLGNMLFLHVFGTMAEARLGRLRFLLFYLATGYLALVGFAAAHTESTQPLVGASGAISGVLGAFLFLFPQARVTSLFPFLFFLPLRFPAWLVLPFWCTLQWLAARQSGPRPGVAYLAHLIGFGIGFLYALACWRGRAGAEPDPKRPATVKGPVQATEGDSQP
ncbi:rhomboid family intramembrane serine protease [Streptomyces zagrosensis]|uniref:Membrane associated rhomboid family serine protease n=1 Tax=Streptomyces zagrosensis TaxID=1042984 RepID=A0A7W9Q4L7_9ACTN|nr:rhomboid family intramembrane serine protease [Streptomyces zagrosensis]MBB5933430.1 membrane associated rhomboid family serine protease [Streptomyces zagrosensis]